MSLYTEFFAGTMPIGSLFIGAVVRGTVLEPGLEAGLGAKPSSTRALGPRRAA